MSAGECRFCGIGDAQVDGDRVAWLSAARDVCNKYGCRSQYFAELRKKYGAGSVRRRSSAEVHALILKEAAGRRKRAREAAKARGLLREKGERG